MKYLLAIIILGVSLGVYIQPTTPHLFQYKPPTVTTRVQNQPSVDELVDKYSKKYGKTRYEQNRIKAMVHYLLLREQNYCGSNAMGDGGLAGGCLQFHEQTYIGYRKIMIQRRLVDIVGSRFDMDNAIETTCWAISDGREEAWGPIARREIKI